VKQAAAAGLGLVAAVLATADEVEVARVDEVAHGGLTVAATIAKHTKSH